MREIVDRVHLPTHPLELDPTFGDQRPDARRQSFGNDHIITSGKVKRGTLIRDTASRSGRDSSPL
jgi:hypothetical protein